MSDIVIKVENLSKHYRLGQIGSSTIRDDLERFWAKLRGKEDPSLKLGHTNLLSPRSQVPIPIAIGTKPKGGEYVWALRDINFEVKQGEVLGIIGKNGAGKSTLLKILSKVTSPTTGSITVTGRIASLLEVGTGFHPELSGRENVFLNGAILGMSKAEIRKKFDEIVDFSGVENYIDTPVKRYSSGMYVRLAFAVAAHLEPEILVVDEVLAVGDADFQKKALGKMQHISTGQGRTVLFVSHNLGSIMALCDKSMLLGDGVMVEYGHTKEVVEKYLSQSINDQRNMTKKNYADKDMFISNIDAYDCKNRQKSKFLTNESIRIRIIVEGNIWDNNAVLGFYLKDMHQRKLFTAQYFLKDISRSERKTFVAEIPSDFLTPSHYYVSAAVHIPNIRVIDSAEDALDFRIVDSGTDFHFYEGSDYGSVFANIKWEVID